MEEDLAPTSVELVVVPRDSRGVARQAVRVAVGTTLAAAVLTADALQRSRSLSGAIQRRADPSLLALVPGAVLGLSLTGVRRASALATRALDTVGAPVARAVAPAIRPLEEPIRRALEDSDRKWRAAEVESMQAAAAFVRELEPQIVRALLEPLDLTTVVGESVDLNELAERIDVDRVAERLDLDAIILRLDLPKLVEEVLAEIDVAELIRQSTGTLTGDAIDEVRYVSVDADRVVARLVDRIIRRRRRQLDAPGEPESTSVENESETT
ncbi:hypothetical protein BH20ACT23_BH20ACT23_17430 [soil metagenome]